MRSLSDSISQWTFVAVVAFSLALYQVAEIASKRQLLQDLRLREHPEDISYSYEDGDRPTELPLHLPEAAMTIEWPDDQLYGIYEDEEWLSLFPRSHGWLELGPKDELFVVSMYHQLHCLDALRYGYASAKTGALSFPGNGTGVEHHVNHCLTFLKETILCNADLTLEVADFYRPVSPGSTKMQHGVSGMGMVHRCHDWTKVRDWLEVNFEKRLAKGTVDETTTAEILADF